MRMQCVPGSLIGFRTSLHYFPCFAFINGVKECGGYTVVLLLVTTEEKSVGYTVFLHLNEGRKECGYTVFLHLNEGRKECGGTLFFSILMKEEKSVGYTVFLRV